MDKIMSEVCVFLADGFEEIEGLTVVDLLRRAGIETRTVSIMGHFFLLLFGLVLVLFLDVGDHRLESGHLGHALLLVELQRDAEQADDDGEDDDVPAVVRDEVVDPLHHIAERYTEDVQNIHVSVHSAPPVVRDGYFYRRTHRPQLSTSQEAL